MFELNPAQQAEVIKTVSTLGWKYIEMLAEQSVRTLETEALACEEPAKSADLVAGARMGRKMMKEFLRQVKGTRDADLKSEPIEVLFEYGE